MVRLYLICTCTPLFESFWSFETFVFPNNFEKQACSENRVKFDSRRLHTSNYLFYLNLADATFALGGNLGALKRTIHLSSDHFRNVLMI